jgi:hypothetical protein
MNLQNLEIRELSLEEKRAIEGGFFQIALAAVVVVAVVAFGVGVYNGYKAAERDAQ